MALAQGLAVGMKARLRLASGLELPCRIARQEGQETGLLFTEREMGTRERAAVEALLVKHPIAA